MDVQNYFDDIPDFDNFFNIQDEFENEGEEWKPKPKRQAAKKLYEQAWRILIYAQLFCESLKEDEEKHHASLIMENATILCPKIAGAEGGNNYIILMENASIIRTNAIQLKTQLFAAAMFNQDLEEYAETLIEEIEVFKLLFKVWVQFFEKDDVKDDWGLY